SVCADALSLPSFPTRRSSDLLVSGPTCVRSEGGLGGALEALFDTRSGDDVVAVAEAKLGLPHPLLVPELLETLAETLELGGCGLVVAVGQDLPQLGPPFARLLDLLMNFHDCHVSENAVRRPLIPVAPGRTTRPRGRPGWRLPRRSR